ncbi:MAG: flagellar hook capping FlgD N-terminal domain-containing protein [Acidimicrobiales bacterium]
MTMPVDRSSVPVGDIAPPADTSGMASLLAPNTFLSLLVDELKYQNPLDPTSSADFMNQIAELSQVEQLETVSSSSQMSQAEGLLGASVTGNDASGSLVTGVVTGVTNTSNGPEVDFGNGDTMSLTSITQIGVAPSTSPNSAPSAS